MIHKLKPCLDRLLPKTVRRIGDVLRKSGAIAGIGIVGFVLTNDDVTATEAIILIASGLILWLFGLYFEYFADKMERKPHIRRRIRKSK